MKYTVTVKTGARQNLVQKQSHNELLVLTTAIPEKGSANRAVLKLLAEYFKVPQYKVAILAGHKSKKKIIETNDLKT